MEREERSDRFTAIEDQFSGYEVYDYSGQKIGKVDDLFVDESDNPEYIGVKMGFLGTRSTLIPMGIATVDEAASRIEVALPDTAKIGLRCPPRYAAVNEFGRALEAYRISSLRLFRREPTAPDQGILFRRQEELALRASGVPDGPYLLETFSRVIASYGAVVEETKLMPLSQPVTLPQETSQKLRGAS